MPFDSGNEFLVAARPHRCRGATPGRVGSCYCLVSFLSSPLENRVGSVSSQPQSQLNGGDLRRLIGNGPFWSPCVGGLFYYNIPHKYFQNKDYLFPPTEIALKKLFDANGKKWMHVLLNLVGPANISICTPSSTP